MSLVLLERPERKERTESIWVSESEIKELSWAERETIIEEDYSIPHPSTGKWLIPSEPIRISKPEGIVPSRDDWYVRRELRKMLGLPEEFELDPDALDRLKGLIGGIVGKEIDSVELVKSARGL